MKFLFAILAAAALLGPVPRALALLASGSDYLAADYATRAGFLDNGQGTNVTLSGTFTADNYDPVYDSQIQILPDGIILTNAESGANWLALGFDGAGLPVMFTPDGFLLTSNHLAALVTAPAGDWLIGGSLAAQFSGSSYGWRTYQGPGGPGYAYTEQDCPAGGTVLIGNIGDAVAGGWETYGPGGLTAWADTATGNSFWAGSLNLAGNVILSSPSAGQFIVARGDASYPAAGLYIQDGSGNNLASLYADANQGNIIYTPAANPFLYACNGGDNTTAGIYGKTLWLNGTNEQPAWATAPVFTLDVYGTIGDSRGGSFAITNDAAGNGGTTLQLRASDNGTPVYIHVTSAGAITATSSP